MNYSSLTIHQILKQYWGFDAFRPLQQEIIESVLIGNDTLALMPTGGGKSLCYQVPALAQDGLCLVISPLIALMKDQVENLRKKNITAYAIFSGMSRKDVINTLKTATESNCKFLYVSPERLETSLFKEYLPGMNIKLVAVDEAHCISQWGYDFRPPYLRIATLREELVNVPVLALTASATQEVQEDICDKLGPPQTPPKEGLPKTPKGKNTLHQWNIFRQSFERANLSFSVFNAESKINKLTEILNKVSGSAIVYCKSRRRTKEISELLHLQNINADFYHAGLTQEQRNAMQESWIKNKTRVIVCTNAFGMGIDKADVRVVVHADVPDCIESYYQEAGRAGRDGKKSYAVLLYDNKDLQELEEQAVIKFPSLEDIRKVYQALANYLQIPSGAGKAQYYDFDISDFVKKFNLNIHTAVNALKALEQDGWLSFNEQVFISSAVQFVTGKEYLYKFEKEQPVLEPVIKALLRGYAGIFDFKVSISEAQLVRLVKKPMDEIKKDLIALHRFGIIEYLPQKDTPQIYLLRNRMVAEELQIDMTGYKKRKEKYIARVKTIVRFVNEKSVCRSKFIGNYFGDDKMKKCGTCDNCLNRKANELSTAEFESIYDKLKVAASGKKITAKELTAQITEIKKEKVIKVLEFLLAENKIKMDEKGFVKF